MTKEDTALLEKKNFADALKVMNFTANGNRYEKIFADGVVMTADLAANQLSYPAQIRDATAIPPATKRTKKTSSSLNASIASSIRATAPPTSNSKRLGNSVTRPRAAAQIFASIRAARCFSSSNAKPPARNSITNATTCSLTADNSFPIGNKKILANGSCFTPPTSAAAS